MKKSWFVIAAAIPLVVVGSIGVWQLSGNDARRIGQLGPLSDPVPLSWRGEWSSEMSYRPGEVVSFEGSSYVAESEVTGTSPGSTRLCGRLRDEGCPWAAMMVGLTGRLDLHENKKSECTSTVRKNVPGPAQYECIAWSTVEANAVCPAGKVPTSGAGQTKLPNGWVSGSSTGGWAEAWAICYDGG